MTVALPSLPAEVMRKFAGLVEHVTAHERRTAELVYDPVAAPQQFEPLLLESVFDPALFDDTLFLDLFTGMSVDPERAINGLFRVYIDGMLSPEHENGVLYARPAPGESFHGYLTRVVGDRAFGIVVNGAEQWSWPLARMAARAFAPIIDAVGPERSTLEVTLFIGNYGYTPFGIHIDDPYTSVVHFHVGPATKEMTLFGKEEFHRLNGERKNCFQPQLLVPHGRTFTIRPGDLFLLPPHYYHIGNTPSFSVGVAIAISKYPAATMTRQILSRAVTADSFAVPLDDLLARAEGSGESFATWLRRERDEFKLQVRSRANLRYSNGRYDDAPLELDVPLALDPDFPITHAEFDEDLILYARGNRIRLARNALTARVVQAILEAPVSIFELHLRLHGEVSMGALQAVVQQLIRFGGLRRCPEGGEPCSTRPAGKGPR
jgi:hypothetical protein